MKKLRALCLVGAALAISCNAVDSPSAPASTRTLTGLSLSHASVVIGRNATVQLQATASYSDASTADVTSSATWTTGNAAIAAVSSGTVTGSGLGRGQVQAAFGGKSASAEVTVRRNLAMGTSVTVSTVNATVAALRASLDGTVIAVLGSVSDHYALRTRTIAFSEVNVTPGEHAIGVEVLGFPSVLVSAETRPTAARVFTAAPAPVIQLSDADTGESLSPIPLSVQEVTVQTKDATITWQFSVPVLDR